MSVSQNITLCE